MVFAKPAPLTKDQFGKKNFPFKIITNFDIYSALCKVNANCMQLVERDRDLGEEKAVVLPACF